MATQWRKSKTSGPFRVTAGKHGISTSIGWGPLRISRGADGKTRRTIRAPGTGIYSTEIINDGKESEAPMERPATKRHPWLMLFLFASIAFLVVMIFI